MKRKLLIIANIIALLGLAMILAYPTLRAKYQIKRHFSQVDLTSRVVNADCLPPSIMEPNSNYEKYISVRDFQLNDDGIIKYKYGSNWGNAKWQTTPLHVARFGMAGLRSWCIDSDQAGLAIAFRHAEWLVDEAKILNKEYAIWLYNFPFPMFQVEAGWTGGMANAYDIAFLTQMYHLTMDPEYKSLIQKGINSFALDMNDGGVRALMADGTSVFFEEYAQPGIQPGHVLNGHMFALNGLAYVGDNFDSQLALDLFEQGAAAVASYAPSFDTGEATFYSLGPESPIEFPIEDYPHRIHTRYMAYLYNRLGDPVFKEYAQRWAEYLDTSFDEVDGKLVAKN